MDLVALLSALLMGVVEGLTEFLPISSTGHLLLAPHLLGWQEQPLAFDVALHIGTLLALLGYFRADWWRLAVDTLADLRRSGPYINRWSPQGRLTLLLVVGTAPALLAGLTLSGLEDRLRTPGVVAAMLVLGAAFMAAAERWAGTSGSGEVDRLSLTRAATVGVAQAAALVPGVSRSGATIATGMLAGLSRATAARFSFLLATPVTLAAAVKEVPSLRNDTAGIGVAEIGIGAASAFIAGMLAIAFLLRYLSARSLYPYVWYRVALAAVVLLVLR